MQLFRLLFTIARHFTRPSVFPRTSLENAIFVPNIACNRPLEGWLLDFFHVKRVLSNLKRMSQTNTRYFLPSQYTYLHLFVIVSGVYPSTLKFSKNTHASFIIRYLTRLPQNPVSHNKNVLEMWFRFFAQKRINTSIKTFPFVFYKYSIINISSFKLILACWFLQNPQN